MSQANSAAGTSPVPALTLRVLPPEARTYDEVALEEEANWLYELRNLEEPPKHCDFRAVITTPGPVVLGAVHAHYLDHSIWVDRLAVSPRYERRGIGTTLLGTTVARLTRGPDEVIELNPSSGWIEYYEKLGFKPIQTDVEILILQVDATELLGNIARRAMDNTTGYG